MLHPASRINVSSFLTTLPNITHFLQFANCFYTFLYFFCRFSGGPCRLNIGQAFDISFPKLMFVGERQRRSRLFLSPNPYLFPGSVYFPEWENQGRKVGGCFAMADAHCKTGGLVLASARPGQDKFPPRHPYLSRKRCCFNFVGLVGLVRFVRFV